MADLARVLQAEVAGSKVLADEAALLAAIARGGGRILTVNLYHLALFRRDPAFAAAFSGADFWTADGWPVQMLWRLAGTRVDRVTGRGLCELLASEGVADLPIERIAVVGGSQATGDRFAKLLESGGRQLVFREHGDRAGWDAGDMSRAIQATGAELVLVAVSSPFCELFAHELRGSVTSAVVGVGGGMDMVTGAQPAAPAVAVAARMEWLWRLAHNPRRLLRRYIVDCLPLLVLHAPGAVVRARRPPRST